MANKKVSFRHGVEKRMEFIEFRLLWEGGINRSDITEKFRVSAPQASNDLTQYREVASENITYDLSSKRYHASEKFKPLFIQADPDHYLSQMKSIADRDATPDETWISTPMNVASVPVPHRRVNMSILKALIDSVRDQRSLNIHYQTMSEKQPDPTWRWVTPHAFANDGVRWHVRAFCHTKKKFQDFHLSRILDVDGFDEPQSSAEHDHAWNEMFDVILIPNPEISNKQQETIAAEYGMRKGKLSTPVRKALLFYFKKSLRIDAAIALKTPYEAPLVIENKKEFEVALAES